MKRLLIAASIATVLLSPAAFAGKHHRHHHHRHHAATAQDWKTEGRHDNGLHLGHLKHERWARGQRLPDTYLRQTYYVRDYNTYHLAPPPNGYVWVRPYQDSNDYYMVQAATGLIQQIFGL
jgi:Ni/Co efflux regulator RcnB